MDNWYRIMLVGDTECRLSMLRVLRAELQKAGIEQRVAIAAGATVSTAVCAELEAHPYDILASMNVDGFPAQLPGNPLILSPGTDLAGWAVQVKNKAVMAVNPRHR